MSEGGKSGSKLSAEEVREVSQSLDISLKTCRTFIWLLLGANHSRFPVRDPGLEFTTSVKDIRHERAYEKDLPVTPFEIGVNNQDWDA